MGRYGTPSIRGPQAEREIVRIESAARSRAPTHPVESPDTLIVEDELRDRPRDLCVAHERQCAVVEDEPPMIDPDCHDSMIFVRQSVPQHSDPHFIFRESCRQQRHVFDNRMEWSVSGESLQ